MNDLKKFKQVCESNIRLKKLLENLALAALRLSQKELEITSKKLNKKTVAEEVSDDLDFAELENKCNSEKSILEKACKEAEIDFPAFNKDDICRLYR